MSESSKTTGLDASVTERIKAKARAIGFHKVGIARAEVLNEERERLETWLRRGFHGEMPYLARDPGQRTDPGKIFPGARSVIAVALNYYTDHQHEVGNTSGSGRVQDEPVTGKVSRYAWGDDYHEVVGEKLRELLTWIKEEWPAADGKACVDIQPVMDKAWAVRAGLGWMGKHANVIAPELGSWIFLGELFVNLELAADDDQIADQCGSCTLCIDACPTGAIVEPYVLNANLCISHATIESRAVVIRDDIAANLDGWLYGCDVCQDVCPWNHSIPATEDAHFEPRAGNINAKLAEILELTPETYAARFRHSAMKRAKLAGLQRNARALLNGLGASPTTP
jgi:epoxyqueuosine reductase